MFPIKTDLFAFFSFQSDCQTGKFLIPYNENTLEVEINKDWQIEGRGFTFVPYLINKRIIVIKARGTLTQEYTSLMGAKIREVLAVDGVNKLISVSDLSNVTKISIGVHSEMHNLVTSDLSDTREHEYIIPSPKIKSMLTLDRVLVDDFRKRTTMVDSFEEGMHLALERLFGNKTVKKEKRWPASVQSEGDLQSLRINQLINLIQSISLDQNFKPVNCNIPEDDPFKELFEAFYGLQNQIGQILGEMTDLNLNLERLVEERTQKLLRQFKKMQNLKIQLDRFIYSASHELRAPVVTMLGLIELIEIEVDKSKKETYLKLLKNTINQQNELIKQVIQISENKKSLLHKDHIEFEKIFKEVIGNLGLPEQKIINLKINIDQESPFFTDRTRLKTIISNLLKNAFQYNLDKEIRLEATVKNTSAVIIVQDYGAGIDPVALPHIFDVFYRASEGSSGMGLGLFIVKEMVDSLHGVIRVDSQPNAGSKFEILLPCLMAHTFPNTESVNNWCDGPFNAGNSSTA